MDTTAKGRLPDFKERLFANITEVPLVLQQSHIPGLDGLRAISIILVIVSHFTAFSPYKKYFNGDIGVEIFFAISGFLITSLLLKERVKRDKVSFKNFYIRRILRIVPVAYAYLLILMLLDGRLGLNINPAEFITGFLYIKNIPIKDAADWYTGHFWSLSVEEQFYIGFPLFIVTQTNKFVAAAVVLIIVSPVFNVLVFNNVGIFYSNHALHIASVAFVSLFGRGTASILTGSLFAILLFKKIIMVDKLKNRYFLSFVLFIVAVLSLTPASAFYIQHVSECIFPFIIGYIILLNLKGANFFRELLETRLMVKIGVLSYSIYIWQQLFTTNFSWHLMPVFDTLPVRVILLCIVSWISYHYFEKFFLRYKRHFQEV